MDRRIPGWVWVGDSETHVYFRYQIFSGEVFTSHVSRESLRNERPDEFTFQPPKNLRDRQDPSIDGDGDRYRDLIVGRAGEEPPPRLKPFFGKSAQPIDAAGPDKWIKLIPGGRIDCRDDRGPFQMADPERVIENTKALGMLDDAGLPIDLNHQTDIAAKTGGEAPAVGWIHELQARGGDLYGRVQWTKAGLAAVSRGPNGEPPSYRYLSPVFAYNPQTHEVMQLLRAGLTNNPNLYRLAICARNSRENVHSLSSVEAMVCQRLGISRQTFSRMQRNSEGGGR